jgi:hypothetical protein
LGQVALEAAEQWRQALLRKKKLEHWLQSVLCVTVEQGMH